MADLAVRLRVFIASPGDLSDVRNAAESVILDRARSAVRHGLLLEPYRWESGSRPGLGRTQDSITPDLIQSELTVAMFWSRLGTPAGGNPNLEGTLEELDVAETLVRRGESDEIFVYFCEAPPRPDVDPKDISAVKAFKTKLETLHSFGFRTFTTAEDFTDEFGHHLDLWLERWEPISRICQWTLAQSGPGFTNHDVADENRLLALTRNSPGGSESRDTQELENLALAMYQDFGPAAVQVELNRFGIGGRSLPKSDEALLAFVRSASGQWRFRSEEWFFYFCARGLLRAIVANDPTATTRREYVNPIHQYLAALFRRMSNEAQETAAKSLVGWLQEQRFSPITRNFAAYVLGMARVTSAQDDLARAATRDSGLGVHTYAIMSLGRLRSRRHLSVLVNAYETARNDEDRLLAGQSVCNAIGIMEYPL